MLRSIATVSLGGTLERKLQAAHQAGFDAVEIVDEGELATCAMDRAIIRRWTVGQDALRVSVFQPFRDFEGVADHTLRCNLVRAEATFALMSELGAKTLLVCSNTSPTVLDDDGRAADQLHQLADRARQHGIRIAYEALAWGTCVRSYLHSWRIVQRANHSHLGVCLDSFHILARGDDPAGIKDIPGEQIFLLQVADAPPSIDLDVRQWSRHHRCFPGQGSWDLVAFLGHVAATGYTGPLSLEVFNDAFRSADPGRTAIAGMRSLVALEAAVLAR
ncbi:sugar phosphate isomerase/epimerase family protein [Plantactinospora sp. WMMB334]|uniref:sugar phosphate isomerase/epimerase family protein n=1 Tax=Plantactinospora sp. WMMB334 TaxID=3404119 RepID=UPI003B94EE01